jgi:hypothetical protein
MRALLTAIAQSTPRSDSRGRKKGFAKIGLGVVIATVLKMMVERGAQMASKCMLTGYFVSPLPRLN